MILSMCPTGSDLVFVFLFIMCERGFLFLLDLSESSRPLLLLVGRAKVLFAVRVTCPSHVTWPVSCASSPFPDLFHVTQV